jgi:hypothetical protein
VELLSESGLLCLFGIELACRLRLLVSGFFQLTLKLGDVFFGSRDLLMKLVEASINLTRFRGLMDQAECSPIW